MNNKKPHKKNRQIAVGAPLRPEQIRRSPKFELVDPALVHTGTFDPDPRFDELWSGCQLRNEDCGFTRITVDRIQSGFSVLAKDGSITINRSPIPSEDSIKWMMKDIIAS